MLLLIFFLLIENGLKLYLLENFRPLLVSILAILLSAPDTAASVALTGGR
jgi:uncharacterized MnhB-related membrane protein